MFFRHFLSKVFHPTELFSLTSFWSGLLSCPLTTRVRLPLRTCFHPPFFLLVKHPVHYSIPTLSLMFYPTSFCVYLSVSLWSKVSDSLVGRIKRVFISPCVLCPTCHDLGPFRVRLDRFNQWDIGFQPIRYEIPPDLKRHASSLCVFLDSFVFCSIN